jgi:hypothetical protein
VFEAEAGDADAEVGEVADGEAGVGALVLTESIQRSVRTPEKNRGIRREGDVRSGSVRSELRSHAGIDVDGENRPLLALTTRFIEEVERLGVVHEEGGLRQSGGVHRQSIRNLAETGIHYRIVAVRGNWERIQL